MAEDGFINLVSRFKPLVSGSEAHPAPAVVSPPRAQASSGLLLRPHQPDAANDDSADEARLAWKAWMKESINEAEGISCNVLNWWKANSPRFSLIAKAAKIVLACVRGNLRAAFQAG